MNNKIAFLGFPAIGHTYPTLKIVEELVKNNYQVDYYSFDFIKEDIKKTGANFISLDKYINPEDRPDSSSIGIKLEESIKSLVNISLSLEPELNKLIKNSNPNLIIGDSMAIWAKKISTELNIPLIVSISTFAFNQESQTNKGSLKDLFKFLISLISVNRHLRRLKKENYNINDLLDIILNDVNYPSIIYTSKLFQPKSEIFPNNFQFCGPMIRDRTNSYKKKKAKLIYISFGTVNNNQEELIYELINILEGQTDIEVIISTGKNSDLFKRLNQKSYENIIIKEYIDQLAVLNEADMFISHGGMNSVSESLYLGIPLLLIPQTEEQKMVSDRVLTLGAGLVVRNKDELKKLIDEVLSNPIFRENALIIGKSFKKANQEFDLISMIKEIMNNKN